jgi:uncharacterized protein (DUF924 family)
MLGALVAPEALLGFWFGELAEGLADARHRARWFKPCATFDQECRARFGLLLTERAPAWGDSAPALLARIILYDQIPRNIFRGTAAAFAYDTHARKLARQGIAKGKDKLLSQDERAFFYRPFEHSEDILDQYLSVGLYTTLRDQAPKSSRSYAGSHLRSAQQHRDIILDFGRFPHRNVVLGRQSTPLERAFMTRNAGFGQN